MVKMLMVIIVVMMVKHGDCDDDGCDGKIMVLMVA